MRGLTSAEIRAERPGWTLWADAAWVDGESPSVWAAGWTES